MTHSRYRLLAPFLAALLVLSGSLIAAWVYYQEPTAGLAGFLQDGFKSPLILSFAQFLILKEILPLYLGASIAIWLITLGFACIFEINLRKHWTFKQAFVLTLAAFGWIHLVLWWQVPTALWVITGLQQLPFAIGLPLVVAAILLPLGYWSAKQWGARTWVLIPGWLLLWTGLSQAPFLLSRRVVRMDRGDRPVQALLIGVDGLRPEEANAQGLLGWSGTHFPNAYTPVPATRLFYSLLWGGDPDQFSMGHVIPSEPELKGKLRYELLEAYKSKGLKVRFYIDDGGTIGLTQRSEAILDEIGMPAAGWENFINSNLAVHLPFYASWLDALRVFPSTNPWAGLDTGLRNCIERGRGADLVMFHSCHLHQPIFLTRKELADIPRWWTLRPLDLKPIAGLPLVRPQDELNSDVRKDPILAYQIRVRHLLAAWGPIWESLSHDKDYAQATRFLLADHGERFYHVTPTLRLQGTHGYDLNPWEVRVPFLAEGPGFQNGSAPQVAVGLLELRDALAKKLLKQQPIAIESFGKRPFAAMRYHTLKTDFLRPDPDGVKYLNLDPKTIIAGSTVLEGGAWVMRYQASYEERNKGLSLARAIGNRLDVFKPLEGGGAHHLSYEGFKLVKTETINQEMFLTEKAKIETEFNRRTFSEAEKPN